MNFFCTISSYKTIPVHHLLLINMNNLGLFVFRTTSRTRAATSLVKAAVVKPVKSVIGRRPYKHSIPVIQSSHFSTTTQSGSVPAANVTAVNSSSAEVGSSATAEKIPGSQREVPKYVMMYTCSVCETRSTKQITKQSYHEGTVLIKCPGCGSMHLICDHIGMMGDKGWNIEDYVKEKSVADADADGERIIDLNSNSNSTGGSSSFKFVNNDNVYELTMNDLMGSTTTTNTTSESK